MQNFERFLLMFGKTVFFILGYYTVSKFLVNYYLRNFTQTGWQFNWDFFRFLVSKVGMHF